MKKLQALLIAVTASLALGACSSGSADKESSDKPDSSTAPAAATSVAPDKSLGNPVAERTADVDGFKLKLKIYPIKRSGELTNLNFSMTRTDDAEGDFLPNTYLSDGDKDSGDAGPYSADGVKLLDPASKQVYLVASDGAGNCLCSRGLGGSDAYIGAGETRTFSATYAAPPKSVSSIDLMFPNFGTVTGVALN